MNCKKYYRLVLSVCMLMLFSLLSPCVYSSEIIDSISVHTEANQDVMAVVKFSVPIQYLRHFPRGESPFTSIYFNVLSSVPASVWRDYESHRTPPSDTIKDITISTRDRATGPKLHVTFYRPAEFTVSMGRDSQTLLIRVKSTTSQKQNEAQTAPVEPVAKANPVAVVAPVVVPTIAKTPAIPAPTAPAVAAVSAKPNAVQASTVASPPVAEPHATSVSATPANVAPVSATPVSDGVIDEIVLHTAPSGEVNAEVKFALPLRYLRHFPRGKSEYTTIYFDTLNTSSTKWTNYESHTSLSSDLVQDITVSTRDKRTGPKMLVRLSRPARFAVSLGKNDRFLFIHIKPVTAPENNGRTVASGISSGAAVAAVPVAALPTIASTPAPPTVAAATASVTPAPAPAPASAAVLAEVTAPVTSVAPSGDVTKPNVVLQKSNLKPIHIQLGGTDGLPRFPDIDQQVPLANIAPSAKPSLADQITKANNEAGVQMEKGGRAVLAGQMILAIESFNNVLNLPPNKYSQDAQLWVGIAKERSGQISRAILEFDTYLKLYPKGTSASWVKERLDRLKLSQPALFANLAKPTTAPIVHNTEFQYSEFGSMSVYYYQGQSQTTTSATAGVVQSQNTISNIDQKSMMANVNVTARSYNNEYDNRLVFQNYYAANFLQGQASTNRLGAAFYELKDRIVDYSVKVGRQSGFGGGVMGRFDGVSAGYGFGSGMRANVVAGRLADFSSDVKPTFTSYSLDFGTRSALGGSVYFTNQTVSGITDRRAVGGNLRYFEPRFNLMSMLDYDTQFKAVNILTVQGTWNGGGVGANDYNFLLDRRRSPILDVRNAVNGTAVPLSTLIQNGYTTSDLVLLADQRTASTNLAQVGMTNHLSEKWIIGTDFSASNTSGLPSSGGPVDPTVGCIATEGCVDATPATGVAWSISERFTGLGMFRPNDVTNFSVSYTKSQQTTGQAFQVSNHIDLDDKWTLDSALSLNFQSISTGSSKSNDIAPSVRASYKVRNNLTADGQLGLDWSHTTTSVVDTSNTANSLREYIALGFTVIF